MKPEMEIEPRPDDEAAGTEYHVNYRGPNYLADVWYLCGAYDNLAEARDGFGARLAADLAAGHQVGSEWRLVGVRAAVVVAVIEHVRLTAKGTETVLEDKH